MTAELGVPISFHEEDPAYITNNGVNRGAASEFFGIGGSDRMAEISMVERDVAFALETGASINIQHISTAEGVELVRQGKVLGGSVWAEATPHHIALTEAAVPVHGTMAKMNPPLRTDSDRLAIIQGLVDGTVDLIATDHAPHSVEEKAKSITEARENGEFKTIHDLRIRTGITKSNIELLQANHCLDGMPDTDQVELF